MWNNEHNLETDSKSIILQHAMQSTGFIRGPNVSRIAIWAAFCGQGTDARRLGPSTKNPPLGICRPCTALFLASPGEVLLGKVLLHLFSIAVAEGRAPRDP
jgi:hypothetical protein